MESTIDKYWLVHHFYCITLLKYFSAKYEIKWKLGSWIFYIYILQYAYKIFLSSSDTFTKTHFREISFGGRMSSLPHSFRDRELKSRHPHREDTSNPYKLSPLSQRSNKIYVTVFVLLLVFHLCTRVQMEERIHRVPYELRYTMLRDIRSNLFWKSDESSALLSWYGLEKSSPSSRGHEPSM